MTLGLGAGLHVPTGGRVDAFAYWQYIGRWSELFVPSLLAAAETGAGQRVLDLAAGSGEAAAKAVLVVGDAGLVVGADVSFAMLQAASSRLSGSSFRAVVTDGESLAFGDGCFDAVVCQLGLMFFSDPGRGLAEIRRVLRPGRSAAVCVISSADRAPMWGILAECLSRQLPEHASTIELSFALADSARLERLLIAAGFHDVRVWRETREGSIESFEEYWTPIESGTGQLPQAYRTLHAESRRAVRDEVRERLTQYEVDGRLIMSVEMLIGTGRA